MNSSSKTTVLLKLLGHPPYTHSVTALAEKIECTKSGTYKLLSSLVQSGLAAQRPDHKYTLGPVVYLLGKTYEEQIGLSKLVKPYLTKMRDLTGENASFSMLINKKANLIYRVESLEIVKVAGNVGQERPLYAGATGKVLGAFRPEEEIRQWLMEEPLIAVTPMTIVDPEALLIEYATIRRQGYAISDGELHTETMGIGAPVYNDSGNVWAAVSIGAPKSRMDSQKLSRYIYIVKEIAREMSNALMAGELAH